MREVFILEAVQSCEDSPIMGKFLAFVGNSESMCRLFMDQNPDYITSDEPDCWVWRITKMTINKMTTCQDEVVKDFWPNGEEK